MLTEHLLTDDEEQWATLTLDALLPHMPYMFKTVAVDSGTPLLRILAHHR